MHTVIAIDGPAASGKSSVARMLARKIGFLYVNSGAMYRAVTWLVTSRGVSPADASAVVALLEGAAFECGTANNQSTILIDGVDPEPHLTEPAVNSNVSTVSTIPEVRRILVDRQRQFAHSFDLVMEGRDIGSVVFPDTAYKFYVDASPEVRAARRAKQGLTDAIGERDKVDTTRRTSPLVIAEDAHVIESSYLTIDGVVGEIIGRLKLKGLVLPAGV
jgi:CMP/dCMP kinase